jgi:hypothetical protein
MIWKVCQLGIGLGTLSLTFLLEKQSRESTALGYPKSTSGSESWMVHLCIICMSNMENTITLDAVVWWRRKQSMHMDMSGPSFHTRRGENPVHKHQHHWVLFVIFPAYRQITIIDSLYDQGLWQSTILSSSFTTTINQKKF